MRTDIPSEWDDRATLTTMLDYARATVRAKCDGLSQADATRAPVPTSALMTISGVVSHLRWVEYSWFQNRFLGEPDEGPWTDEDPDREMHYELGVPIGELLDAYDEQAEVWRRLVAGRDLDERSALPIRGGVHVTLRWIVLHLIEETARHNGHLDLIRELVDGVTGS